MTLYDLFFTIMPGFTGTPAPTLVESDVNSSTSSGSVSLTFLPLISLSILIPIILFFTYRLFKRAPTLPVRLPLPAAWSQWLQVRSGAKGQSQSTKSQSRLPSAKIPKFLKKLSGLSPVELLPTAVKGIPTPGTSPYAYQAAFQQPTPHRPGLTTAIPNRSLLSRSPSPADLDDDYFLSPTKPREWDLSQYSAPAYVPLRPTSAPPQPRPPSPKPRWSPVKEKVLVATSEQQPTSRTPPFKLNITSLFSTKPTPLTRSSSTSPYTPSKRSRFQPLGVPVLHKSHREPNSPTSSLVPLIDFSTSRSPPSSSISRTTSLATEVSDLGARKLAPSTPLIPGLPLPPSEAVVHLQLPEPTPVFKLVDAPTPEKVRSGLTETPLGPVAMVARGGIQSTPTRASKRVRDNVKVDEPLVRLTDSDGLDTEAEDDDVLEVIQLKPITPMKKRPLPISVAHSSLQLSREASGSFGAGSSAHPLLGLDSPFTSPQSLNRAVEERTEQILVDLGFGEDEPQPVPAPIAKEGLPSVSKYPFPIPMTPPPTAPLPALTAAAAGDHDLNWVVEDRDGEVRGWSHATAGVDRSLDEEDPFLVKAEGAEHTMGADVFEDPFADPAEITFVEEASAPALVSDDEKSKEPLKLFSVVEVEEVKPEFSPWEECQKDDVEAGLEVEEEKEGAEEAEVTNNFDEWIGEDEKTMVAAEVSQLLEDEEEDDMEVEVDVVFTGEEDEDPVGVIGYVVNALSVDNETPDLDEEVHADGCSNVDDDEVEAQIIGDEEETIPVSVVSEHSDDAVVEQFPDPDFLPLLPVSAPIPIMVPQPIILTPSCISSAKPASPLREVPLQTPTPPASPPPAISRAASSRSRSRLPTPEPSPKPRRLTVELPNHEETLITVVPPSALPVEDVDQDQEITPVSPLPAKLGSPLEESHEESTEVLYEEPTETLALDTEDPGLLPLPEAEKLAEPIVITTESMEVEDDEISLSPPGSFPSSSIPASEEKSVAVSRPSSRPFVPSHPGIQKPRSAVDIALAMQLRPGLGPGADPAWMVRFLMSVFGWFVVAVSGNIQ